MSGMRLLLSLIVLVSSAAWPCSRGAQLEREIDKTSPNGLYRVRITITPGGKQSGGSLEKAKVQFLKGAEVVDAYELQQQDQWEHTPSSLLSVVEWLDDNVLRLGWERTSEGVKDELIVSNATDENLKYVSISYSRGENFMVFDVAPGSQVTLHANPWFTTKGSNVSFGYSGKTQSGKKFSNVVEGPERLSPATGPLRFEIKVTAQDLQ